MITRLTEGLLMKRLQKAGVVLMSTLIGLSSLVSPAVSAPANLPQQSSYTKQQLQQLAQQRLAQQRLAQQRYAQQYYAQLRLAQAKSGQNATPAARVPETPQTRAAQIRAARIKAMDLSAQDLVLVMPNAGANKEDLKEALEEVHGTVVGVIGKAPLQVMVIHAPKGKSAETEKKLSKDKKMFRAVCMNTKVTLDYAATDPRIGDAWHLPLINCPAAWDIGLGTPSQFGQKSTVAVLDTGCSFLGDQGGSGSWGADVSSVHENIATKLMEEMEGFAGTDFFSDDVKDLQKEMDQWSNQVRNVSHGITDNDGHGTAVASIIAGRENGKAAVGVAPGASIFPIKIADPPPMGGKTATDQLSLISGMIVAINSGARIINISYSDMNDPSQEVLHEMFKYFYYNRNGLIFVSAGNDGTIKPWKDCPYLETVSALKEMLKVPGKKDDLQLVDKAATRGRWAASTGLHVDFCAPGIHIPFAKPDGTDGSGGGSSYSTPIVAGVAALVLSVNPKLSNRQVEEILKQSCYGVIGGRSSYYGYGMPDAEKAVKLAKGS